jgi:protein kinase C substrate 80K-H
MGLDCCDGSDEYDSGVKCENTCGIMAAKMREEEERLKHLRETGYAKRKEFIEQANQLKQSIAAKMSELEAKKASAQGERAQLELKKNESELKAKEAKEKQDKILEGKQIITTTLI